MWNSNALPTPPIPWITYFDAAGTPYYFNTLTKKTMWEFPTEAPILSSIANPSSSNQHSNGDNSNNNDNEVDKVMGVSRVRTVDLPSESTAVEIVPQASATSHEDAVEQFQQLLRDKKVTSGLSWTEVLPMIVFDSRYKLIKSSNERKRLLSEYQEASKQREIDEREAREAEIRENFEAMLCECTEISSKSRFSDIETLLRHDDRWTALDDRAKVRFEVVDKHLDKLVKLEREEFERKRKESVAAFQTLLDECCLDYGSVWRDVVLSSARDARFTSLPPSDRVQLFDRHMAKLRRQHEEQVQVAREQSRKKARALREQWRALLRQCAERGELHTRTKWRRFEHLMRNNEVYRSYPSDVSQSLRDVFDEFVDDLAHSVRGDKKIFRDILHRTSTRVTTQDTMARLQSFFSNYVEVQSVRPYHTTVILSELLYKATSDERERVYEQQSKEWHAFTEEQRKNQKEMLHAQWIEFLKSLADSGVLHTRTEWHEVKFLAESECAMFFLYPPDEKPSLKSLFGQFQSSLARRVHEDKKVCRQLVKLRKVIIDEEADTVCSLVQKFVQFPELSHVSDSDRTVIASELLERQRHTRHDEQQTSVNSDIHEFMRLLRACVSRQYIETIGSDHHENNGDTHDNEEDDILWHRLSQDKDIRISEAEVWEKLSPVQRRVCFQRRLREVRRKRSRSRHDLHHDDHHRHRGHKKSR